MSDAGGAPWWLATVAGGVAALAAAVGKVWSDQRSEILQLRAELAAANERIVELQQQDHTAHLRDLRRMAGISNSVEPPAAWPPPVIRPRPPKR